MKNIDDKLNKNKLKCKIKKRIGLKATTKDSIKTGVITGFIIHTLNEGTPKERLTVDYTITYGNRPQIDKDVVNESRVILQLKPNM